MADVFLSYARPSADRAKQVASALREQGFTVWFDENLPAHKPYAEVIETELDSAAAVLVLWSEPAIASQWVRSEANRARETGRLVQARLDSARIPMPFDQIQCADLSHWTGRIPPPGWQSVVASIAALANRNAPEQISGAHGRSLLAGRRSFLISGMAVGGMAFAGFAGWQVLSSRDHPSAEAQLLLQKGIDVLQSNDAFDAADAGTLPQAIALLTDATRADPKSAIGWGSLALAYAVRKRASPLADRPGFHSRARSAALKALKLDPDEPRALAALRLIDPLYGNWLKAERADRAALKQQPTFPILLFVLSKLLGSVGRWNEAAGLSKKLDRGKFLIPGADRQVVLNLWSAGELQEADDALDIAVQHWPLNPQIWRTRLAYLMYSGRPNEALALLRNESEQPPGIAGGAVAAISATAQALGERVGAEAALATNLKHLKSDPTAAFETIHASASLGDANTAFAILEGYFFGRGEWAPVAPAGGDEDRVTDLLFQPPMRRLWPDPRFNQLVERIGLGRYWRDTHTVPDFRHSA